MSKREVPPDVMVEAIALRQAGYTSLAISQRLGISVRTLQRHFAITGTKKGAIKEEFLQAARDDLLAHITSDQKIKEEAARLIADDIAHAIHLREVILAASAHMKATNLQDSVQVMRAAAAYSTAIKNTSDIVRHSLRVERLTDATDDTLPELIVRELTASEVNKIRDRQSEAEDDDAAVDESEDIVIEA